MPLPTTFLYLTEAEVAQTLTVPQAVDLARNGIQADARGQVVGDKFYTPIAGHGFVKPFTGYIAGEDYFFVKTFNYFQDNPAKFDLPATSSLVLLYEAETGYPACLMEAGWVTALKTAASTAVTAQYLARQDPQTALVFGAGSLGRMHLRALAAAFHLQRAYVIDLYPEIAASCAREVGAELNFPVEPTSLDDREQFVRQADIILTVTTSDQALVERDWLKPGAFIARLGSYQEIDLEVITRADKVIVDNWHYVSSRIPELVQLVKAGRFNFADVHAEWPEVVAENKPGRQTQDEVIVYIALGIWGEYAAILPEVYRQAQALGLGTRLPCSYYQGQLG
jgi:ornithine cyclodeaminase/alanine dehydrogenase-like protein (mu-crystallin family)